MATKKHDQKEMSLLFDLWLLTHSVSGLLDDALVGEELSGDDFGLYSLLRVFGPASPKEISQWTGTGTSTISAALKRLTLRGHSKQQPNPLDRRSYRVALNASGLKAHEAGAKLFLKVMKEVSEALGSEEWHQRISLQRLDSAVREVAKLEERPYTLTSKTSSHPNVLPYVGSPLTRKQEQTVLQYIDFIRSNDRGG